jgi:hypothetical protein
MIIGGTNKKGGERNMEEWRERNKGQEKVYE